MKLQTGHCTKGLGKREAHQSELATSLASKTLEFRSEIAFVHDDHICTIEYIKHNKIS